MANSNKKNRSMKWVVAKFMDGKDYSVLPINWLVETNKENLATSTIKFCKWPPVRSVNSDDLQKAAKPEESWIQYQIKVLGGNKTYRNFSNAWNTKVYESTENEDESVQTKKKRLLSVSSESDDEDNVGFIIEPISVNDVQNEPSSASNNMQNKPYTATNVQNNSFVESDETFYTNLLPQSTTATNDYNDVSNYTYHSMQTPNVHPSVLKSNPDIQVPSYEELNCSNLGSFENHLVQPLPSTSDDFPKQCKRVKNIGSISNRQFNRRIKAQLEAISNTPYSLDTQIMDSPLISTNSSVIGTSSTTLTTTAELVLMLSTKFSI